MKNKIWCFWTGNSAMSPARSNSLQTLKNSSQCEVVLVDKSNIHDFVKKDFPLHKAYSLLSDTHKADYLRSYFMLHYGGGYSDIKPFSFNWLPYFDLLNNESIDLIGRAEIAPDHIGSNDPECKNNYYKLVSVTNFILRKNCDISNEWLSQIHRILDEKFEKLKHSPGTYHPRAVCRMQDPLGVFQPNQNMIYQHDSKDYPLRWAEICGEIFHSIQNKHTIKIFAGMPLQIFSPHQYR